MDEKLKAIFAVVLALAVPLHANAVPLNSAKTADVDSLERTVKLPPGSYPIDAYARYYTVESISHRRMVLGYFVFGGPEPAGRYLHGSPVSISDGGCSVVTVYFDLKTQKVAGVSCNGLA